MAQSLSNFVTPVVNFETLVCSHQHLSLPAVPPYHVSPLKLCKHSSFSHTCSTNLILLKFIALMISIDYINYKAHFAWLLYITSHVTSYISSPNILLSTAFWNTLSLYSSSICNMNRIIQCVRKTFCHSCSGLYSMRCL
jgi:hypothetical protein